MKIRDIHNRFTKVLLSISLLILTSAAQAEFFVYDMQYLKAEQVIPSIKPHLNKDTKISGKDYKLFIEGSQSELTKVQQMLKMLDKKPNNLVIEVRVLDRKLDNWEMAGATIKASGKRVSGNVTKYQTSGRSKVDNLYKLNTLEGYQGYISTGIAFPTHQVVKHYGAFVPKTQYKEAKSGFYVVANKTPQQGYQVTINTQQQRRNPGNSKAIQKAGTGQTFNAHPGKWILIASTDKAEVDNRNKRYQTRSNNSSKRWFYLRVTESIN